MASCHVTSNTFTPSQAQRSGRLLRIGVRGANVVSMTCGTHHRSQDDTGACRPAMTRSAPVHLRGRALSSVTGLLKVEHGEGIVAAFGRRRRICAHRRGWQRVWRRWLQAGDGLRGRGPFRALLSCPFGPSPQQRRLKRVERADAARKQCTADAVHQPQRRRWLAWGWARRRKC